MKLAASAAVLASGLVGVAVGCRRTHSEPARPVPIATRLTAPRSSPHASGRVGDLVLTSGDKTSVTFAASSDVSGHRPLRGALLDFGTDSGDHPDPLMALRFGWRDGKGGLHVGPSPEVDPTDCDGASGARITTPLDGVRVTTVVCPASVGFVASTTVDHLPDGATLADEAHAAPAEVFGSGGRGVWEGERRSTFFGLAGGGVGLLVESPGMDVVGRLVHIGEQTFPSPYTLAYPGDNVVRTLKVVRGDGLSLLATIAGPHRRVRVSLEGAPGRAVVLDPDGLPIAAGEFGGEGREIALPQGFGATLVLEDRNHVEAARVPLGAAGETFGHAAGAAASLSFHITDNGGAPLPIHVTLLGELGTPDPELTPPDGAFAGGRSLYLLRGSGNVKVPPGRYRVTVSHGIGYSLLEEDVVAVGGETRTIDGSLHEAFTRGDWTTGDFHLHAAPSPDAPVSLDARVASLVCEGLDMAIATDHNRITDYAPSVARLGMTARIVTMAGDEITTGGRTQWGHFNLYPLAVPSAAPEDSVPPYYDRTPEEIFSAAHATGARILQVNHPRMAPSIGYFDLTHLDSNTGQSDPIFADHFDAVEAFNGFWLTNPDKVREGAVDLVGLARRGIHVAATGNSDSHHLLYEEAGYPRTYVHVSPEPIETRAARVLDAIARRDTSVSSGPLVEVSVDGKPVGSTVVPVGKVVHVHVRVSAAGWVPVEHVEIWHDDAVAFRANVTEPAHDGVRYEADVTLPFPTDGTVLAWADAETPLPDVLPYKTARAIGFTGLVLIDGDGDGTVDVVRRDRATPEVRGRAR